MLYYSSIYDPSERKSIWKVDETMAKDLYIQEWYAPQCK